MWTFWFVVGLAQAAKICYYPNATLTALSGSLLSSNPQTAGVQKSYSIADVTLSMSSVGNILVTQNVNGSAFQLWASGHNRDCTPECRLVSQGDGNIVAYDKYGAYWGTGTCYVEQGPGCSGTPQQIILSAYYPYWFTPDKYCNVTWKISGAVQRKGAVVSTYDTPITSVSPKSLTTFFNSFGMNTHISQGQNWRDVISSVKYVGASTIRDGAVTEVAQVGLAGIKLNIGAGSPANISELRASLAAIKNVHLQSNKSVVSIEGANEINNWPFVYNKVDYHQSCAGYAQYQSDLYSLVKNDSVFKASGVVVYDLTAGNQGMDCAAQGMLKIDGKADYANIHAYTYQYPIVTAGGDTYSGGMDHDFPGWNANTPRVVTEVGVHTFISSAGAGVNNNTQAKLVVGALINAIADGYSKVFIYQLIDQVWSGYTGPESWFGLFDQFNNPKAAAKVLNQTSRLLQDTNVNSGAALKPLVFGLSGTNQNVRTFLFQSQSRSTAASVYWLAIWQNLPVWNPDTNQQWSNPTLPVTINLGANLTANFSVYNPFSVAGIPSSGSPLVVKTASRAKSISVSVSDYLQLVQITVSSTSSSTTNGVVGATPDVPTQDAPVTLGEGSGTATTANEAFGVYLNGLTVIFCGSIGFLFY